jgi:hypothetical protein
MVTFRDLGQARLSLGHVLVQDGRLVVDDRYEKSVGIDVEALINQVKSVLLAIIP